MCSVCLLKPFDGNCFKILVRDNSSICVNLVLASVHCLFSFGLRFFLFLVWWVVVIVSWVFGALCYENMDLTQISVLIQLLWPPLAAGKRRHFLITRRWGCKSRFLTGLSLQLGWEGCLASAGEGEVQVPLDDTVIHIVCFILGKITWTEMELYIA